MLWKNGTEYLGVEPFGGERTRCDVARASPCVTESRALPKLITNVFGSGGASTHCPERFWTWRPGWSEACRSCYDDKLGERTKVGIKTDEGEKACVVVRSDTLVRRNVIEEWILDNLDRMLNLLLRAIEHIQGVWAKIKCFADKRNELIAKSFDVYEISRHGLPETRDFVLRRPLLDLVSMKPCWAGL
jgi:hypothetical protein